MLLTSLALASCKDNDTELRSALGEKLTLSVGVNSSTASRTMVIGTQLPAGSSIGVRVTDGGTDYQGVDYSHVRFTSAGSGEAQTWTATPEVYLSGQEATIYAYSPYQDTEGFDMTAIPVDMTAADQTDWLYATPLTGPCDASPKADITLNHALTAFTLSFHKEGYPGAGEVTAVKVQSAALATGGTLDATAGVFTEITGQGDALTRTAAFTLDDAVTSASTVQVMMVPTALKAALSVTVTVDGKDYIAATSSMNFIAGHNYALTMKLTAKDLGLSEVEIIDWQTMDLGEDDLKPDVDDFNYDIMATYYIDESDFASAASRATGLDINVLGDNVNLSSISRMQVDGVEVPVAQKVTFTEPGEHVVKFMLTDNTKIGKYTFCWCTGLTSVTLPSTLTDIGEGAFNGCKGLTEVTLPSTLTTIGEDAFWRCSGLTAVNIPEGVTSIGGGTFCGCERLTNVTIPEGVTSIGEYAFYGCTGLTEVTLPSTLTTIGKDAFRGCTGLTEVTLPSTLTTIGKNAFRDCEGLTTITAHATSAPTIDQYMFYNVKSNGVLTVPQGCTEAYSQWMSTANYYLGKYNWTIQEQ